MVKFLLSGLAFCSSIAWSQSFIISCPTPESIAIKVQEVSYRGKYRYSGQLVTEPSRSDLIILGYSDQPSLDRLEWVSYNPYYKQLWCSYLGTTEVNPPFLKWVTLDTMLPNFTCKFEDDPDSPECDAKRRMCVLNCATVESPR